MPDILGEFHAFSFGKVLAKSIVFVAARVADYFYLLKWSPKWGLDNSVWNLFRKFIIVSAWSWVLVWSQEGRLPLVLSRSTSAGLYDLFLWSNIIKSRWRIEGFMFRTCGLTETILCSLIERNCRVFSRSWKFALLTIWKWSLCTSKTALRSNWVIKILIHWNRLFQSFISAWTRYRRMIAVIQRVSKAKLWRWCLDKTMLVLVKSAEIFIHGFWDVDRLRYASSFRHFLHDVRCTSTASYCTW